MNTARNPCFVLLAADGSVGVMSGCWSGWLCWECSLLKLNEDNQVGEDGAEHRGQGGPLDAEEAERLEVWLGVNFLDLVAQS